MLVGSGAGSDGGTVGLLPQYCPALNVKNNAKTQATAIKIRFRISFFFLSCATLCADESAARLSVESEVGTGVYEDDMTLSR